jgi:Domain of unknown function (DUF4280)
MELVKAKDMLRCSFGTIHTPLLIPYRTVNSGSMCAANIDDSIPHVNICPFGGCTLTGQVCDPIISQWKTGVLKTKICGKLALDINSTMQCAIGGIISVVKSIKSVVSVK